MQRDDRVSKGAARSKLHASAGLFVAKFTWHVFSAFFLSWQQWCHCVSAFAASEQKGLGRIRNHNEYPIKEVKLVLGRSNYSSPFSQFIRRQVRIDDRPACSLVSRDSMRTSWWINWTDADSVPTKWHQVMIHLSTRCTSNDTCILGWRVENHGSVSLFDARFAPHILSLSVDPTEMVRLYGRVWLE